MSSIPEDKEVLNGVRALMKKRKVTLRNLSSQIGIPYRTLQNYLNGETRFPAPVFVAVCEALGLGKHYVISGSLEIFHDDFSDAIIRVFGDVLNHIDVDQKTGKVSIAASPSTERAHKAIAGHLLADAIGRAYKEYFNDTLEKSLSTPHRAVRQKVRQ